VTGAMEWQKSVKANSTVSTNLYFAFRYVLKIERNQVKEDKMGGPCSTNGRKEERV
jgi:hypothetical protein